MTHRPNTLLVNPTVTTHPRFPLALLNLAANLDRFGDSHIVDGNIDRDLVSATLAAAGKQHFDSIGIGIMGGPQVAPAIAVSKAIRERYPSMSIIWGGYFPTLYTDTTLAAPYVDYAVRGQGDESLVELVSALGRGGGDDALARIGGLSWRRDGNIVHNPNRHFHRDDAALVLPYEKVGDPGKYLSGSFLGRRTAAHQASIGCRFRCTFCGVAAMFGGATSLPPTERLERELNHLKYELGADSILFYDHNFFDREQDMIPMLKVMAKLEMPWWCFARADALLNLSESTWELVRKSKLRMAYIGAESPNDALLKSIRKGTRSDQTMAVAELCRRHGVIPELSFMVAPPDDPEGETERTFEFIRELKRVNPWAEIIVYIYTPLPAENLPAGARLGAAAKPLLDLDGQPIRFPRSPEEWSQQRWVDYACHADAPWVSDRLRRRIRNFVTVLGCRFPTVQDIRASSWTKSTLSALAAWRYRLRCYDRPWELDLSKKLARLADPRVTGI